MLNFQSPSFLRNLLFADAAAGAASGVLLLAAPAFLAGLFGLPVTLLLVCGAILLLFGAGILYLATRRPIPRPGVWVLIGLNVLWVLDSALLLASGWVTPSATGQAFVIAQALVVAVFAELEYFALRKAPQAESRQAVHL